MANTADERAARAAVRSVAPAALVHMNADHSATCLAYAHFYAGVPDAVAAVMTAMDEEGFVLSVKLADGTVRENVAVPWKRSPRYADEVRKVAVDMYSEAVRELGLQYRLATKAPSFAGDLLRFLVPCGVGLAVATMAVAAVIGFR